MINLTYISNEDGRRMELVQDQNNFVLSGSDATNSIPIYLLWLYCLHIYLY
jgi:hypothetical protein